MANFGEECIFLLGAGASADAGIPTSTMLNSLAQRMLELDDPDPKSVNRQLYNFLLGTLYYHRGLRNVKPDSTSINIEDILTVLKILRNRETDLLFAFVGTWQDKLKQFPDDVLERFDRTLRKFVVEKLNGFERNKCHYLDWFTKLHQSKRTAINIFTLNQDVLLETRFSELDYPYNDGFEKKLREDGEDDDFKKKSREDKFRWNPDLFDGEEDANSSVINIYKLHGSLGWQVEPDTHEIHKHKELGPSDKHLMIFGILEKTTINEPFFELIKRFKEQTRDAKLIVVVGYSFSDEHINKILFDSLRSEFNKKMLIVDNDIDTVKKKLETFNKEVNLSSIEYFPIFSLSESFILAANTIGKKIDSLLDELNENPF